MSKPPKPIKTSIPGLRQRWRARTNDWRVWWEPNATQARAGFVTVELDGTRPTWSANEAERMNLQASPGRPAPASTITVGKNAIDAVCQAYKTSPKFQTLAAKTQKEYTKDINRILAKWQGTDMRQLTKPIVFTWYEALYSAHGAAVARRLVKMLSILMSYAELKGIVRTNPLYRMQMITPKSRKRVATWAEFDALEAAALQLDNSGMRLALYLAMFQGQRVTDIFKARASDFVRQDSEAGQGDLIWHILRSKDTRLERHSALVIHREVLPLLTSALNDVSRPDRPIITRPRGGRYDQEAFAHAFAKVRAQAAKTCPSVADLQFRDLRRTFSSNARHANIPSDDVDDALGNTAGTDAAMRQVYMPASDARAAAAINAIERPKATTTTKKRA